MAKCKRLQLVPASAEPSIMQGARTLNRKTLFLGAAPPASAIEEWVLGLARPAYVYLSEGPLPEDEGEVLVIEIDGKAAPTATEQELAGRRGRRARHEPGCQCQRHRGRKKRERRGRKRRR